MPIAAAIIQGVSCCWCSRRVNESVWLPVLCKKAKRGIIAISILLLRRTIAVTLPTFRTCGFELSLPLHLTERFGEP